MPDTPEQKARKRIDAMLVAAGWLVQDRRRLNLHAALETEDLEHGTLKSRGGLPRALALFDQERLPMLLEELNTALAA
jgi:type I site-specific restriction endonuclease